MTAFLVEGEQGLTWMVDGGQAFATVKDDSTFEIKVPQGHAVIRLTGTPEWRIKRARLNGVDVTEHGFDVPAGGILSNLDVEVTNIVTQLSGTVATTGDGRPRNSVILFAQDPKPVGVPVSPRRAGGGRPRRSLSSAGHTGPLLRHRARRRGSERVEHP